MDIVIVAQYLRDIEQLEGNNSRFLYLANLLSNSEHSVEVITSAFKHITKSKAQALRQPERFTITALDEPGYPRNVCLQRLYSHHVLGRRLSAYLAARRVPDVIYCAVPSLSVASAAASYAERHHVRFIVDVQDLWPEAFRIAVNIPVLSDLAFAPMAVQANRIYAQADEIVAVSETYCRRAQRVNRKAETVYPVFLGTNLEEFDANVRNHPPALEKQPEELWLGYCGTLGASYDLKSVMDALVLLRERGLKPPKLIVMGDGPREEEFKAYAAEKRVDALFTGRLAYPVMCGLLSACDIAVNPITGGAAQSIINKHGDYAASGKPVVTTQESPEYRELVEAYQMGFNCENGNGADLAEKLQRLTEDEALRLEMGRNARRCAEERFDRKNSYTELAELICRR